MNAGRCYRITVMRTPTQSYFVQTVAGLLCLLSLGGCFEVYDGALSVTASTLEMTHSLSGGVQPTVTYTIVNSHKDAVEDVGFQVSVLVTSGGGNDEDKDVNAVSPPTGVTGSDGSFHIASIPAFGSVTVTITSPVEPGTYRWIAKVDPSDAIEEKDEDDNVAVTNVTVTFPPLTGVNLAFGDISDLTATPVGDVVKLSVPLVITNGSGGAIPLLRIDVETAGESTYIRWYLPNVPIGTSTHQLEAVAPGGGSANIGIFLDPSEFISETNEDDNSLIFAFPLGGSS
jgi:hypothetical protein